MSSKSEAAPGKVVSSNSCAAGHIKKRSAHYPVPGSGCRWRSNNSVVDSHRQVIERRNQNRPTTGSGRRRQRALEAGGAGVLDDDGKAKTVRNGSFSLHSCLTLPTTVHVSELLSVDLYLYWQTIHYQVITWSLAVEPTASTCSEVLPCLSLVNLFVMSATAHLCHPLFCSTGAEYAPAESHPD